MLDWIIPFIQGFFSLDIVKYPVMSLVFVCIFNFIYSFICGDEF